MVLLLSLGSVLESWDSIKRAPVKSKRLQISKRDAWRQQQIRDRLHVASTGNKVVRNHDTIVNTAFSKSKSKSAATTSGGALKKASRQQHGRTRLQPYASMFAAPASDWERNGTTGTTTSPLLSTSKLLKVYIYDTLPAKYTTAITSCILKLSGVLDAMRPFSTLATKMADVAILKLFETYPGRVYDPTVADIFVVPYPHASHCYCADGGGWQKFCSQVNATAIQDILSYLTYYNESSNSAARHLFVLSGVQQFTNPRLLEQPLKLFGGNLSPDQVIHKTKGTIVIPYLNDKARFQEIFTAPKSWWTRPRNYAFSFVFGQSSRSHHNANNDPRRVRKLFHQAWIRRNHTLLAALPVYIQAFDHVSNAPKDTVWNAFDRYHESIFCPILAGDSCQQARFFDVMYAGCIPVVLDYSESDISLQQLSFPDDGAISTWTTNLTSWYRKGGETTAAVYPFHRSLVNFGIDYDKCVLSIPVQSQDEVDQIIPAMEDHILHHPERIQEWQRNLRDCAIRTAFGMGRNAHAYDDAFAQIIRMIQHHLQG